MASILIAGCGYVGSQLAKELLQQGHTVSTLVQSEASKRKLEADYETIQLNLDSTDALETSLSKYDTIFYFVPPPPEGTQDTRIQCFLNAIPGHNAPDRIVMISTTGVYGDCGEDWIDETREPQPVADRAKRRYDSEQTLAAWCQNKDVQYRILRVPGIYGPGKLPLERLKQQKPILSLQESPWSNRIHLQDLVQACESAMHYQGHYHEFNVSDGHPSSMSDFFIQVADAFHLPAPEQISLEACKQRFSENMISYLTESKRINNQRMREELGVELRYPTLKQGLAGLTQESS